MPLAVFMRAVNVGVHQRFQPALLAKELAHLDVVNIGAAGTLVVRARASEAAVRREILKRLPFEAEMMICQGRDVTKVISDDPFPKVAPPGDVRRMVTVLAGPPRARPRLPLIEPPGAAWQARVVAIVGRLMLSFWRPDRRKLLDVNKVAEEALGVRATTRNWNTILKVAQVLEGAG